MLVQGPAFFPLLLLLEHLNSIWSYWLMPLPDCNHSTLIQRRKEMPESQATLLVAQQWLVQQCCHFWVFLALPPWGHHLGGMPQSHTSPFITPLCGLLFAHPEPLCTEETGIPLRYGLKSEDNSDGDGRKGCRTSGPTKEYVGGGGEWKVPNRMHNLRKVSGIWGASKAFGQFSLLFPFLVVELII